MNGLVIPERIGQVWHNMHLNQIYLIFGKYKKRAMGHPAFCLTRSEESKVEIFEWMVPWENISHYKRIL
jgi:hypothetical protein